MMDVLSDIKRMLDYIEMRKADVPEAIVRSTMVPSDRAFALRTTKGIYLLVHPDVLASVHHGDFITALWGIRVLNTLPVDAHPLGEEVAWDSISG